MNPENEFDDYPEEEEFSPDPRERDFVAEFHEEVVRRVDNRFFILDENHQPVPAGDLIKFANFQQSFLGSITALDTVRHCFSKR